MTPFIRDGACEECGREYTVSGVSVAPGTETEAPARFRCECGGWLSAFVPGSVNKERLVLTPEGRAGPRLSGQAPRAGRRRSSVTCSSTHRAASHRGGAGVLP